MSASNSLEKLQVLAARFAGLGINPDLASLTLTDAWGLYLFLARLNGGGDVG